MTKNSAIELGGRDTITDPLNDLLRADAKTLIFYAVEVDLQKLLKLH